MEKRKKGAVLLGSLFFIAAFSIAIVTWLKYQPNKEALQIVEDPIVPESVIHTEEMLPQQSPSPKPEGGIYTFLQGPKSWKKKRQWSGSWGKTYMDGGLFGGFGCGFCCMANIYSSLTPYQCSPVDIYEYTKKQTDYSGGGAVAWEYMESMLTRVGFGVKLHKKPKTYEMFRKEIEESQCAIVLVSSYNDSSYWKETPGHYVTIFLYDADSDKVFLADSGEPKRNRQWISLKKVYRALKTGSPKQYLSVYNYQKNSDRWKHEKVNGDWVKNSD